MPGRNYSSGIGLLAKAGFNGKRNDDEVYGKGNFQDYGMRGYDARLARFWGMDPLTGKYPELTPYQFASNSPIMAIDLDGLEAWVNIWGSQSKGPNGHNEVGHAGIVLMNYERVIDKNGQATYRATGDYTYYDFWPVYADLGKGAVEDNVSMSQSAVFTMSNNCISSTDHAVLEYHMATHDMSQSTSVLNGNPETSGDIRGMGEGRPADGIIKLNLSPEQTFTLQEKYRSLIGQNKMYNGLSNNCTSFVCEGLSSLNIYGGGEAITDWRGFLVKQQITVYSKTPNKLYNDLKTGGLQITKGANGSIEGVKQPISTTVVKDGSKQTSESYEDAVLDSD